MPSFLISSTIRLIGRLDPIGCGTALRNVFPDRLVSFVIRYARLIQIDRDPFRRDLHSAACLSDTNDNVRLMLFDRFAQHGKRLIKTVGTCSDTIEAGPSWEPSSRLTASHEGLTVSRRRGQSLSAILFLHIKPSFSFTILYNGHIFLPKGKHVLNSPLVQYRSLFPALRTHTMLASCSQSALALLGFKSGQ